jgi:DNA-directed RNA polymerase III subunit RPC4
MGEPAAKATGTDKKSVSFASDVKTEPESTISSMNTDTKVKSESIITSERDSTITQQRPLPQVDGQIGHLEIYRNGSIKLRLANGILMDVSFVLQASCIIDDRVFAGGAGYSGLVQAVCS